MSQPVYKSYSIEDLSTAFDAVKDQEDWRGPILATVKLEDLGVTLASIEFFTATGAYFVSYADEGKSVILRSQGYRAGPAGP